MPVPPVVGAKSGPRSRRWASEFAALRLSFLPPGFGQLHLAGCSQVVVKLSRVPHPSGSNLYATWETASRYQPVQCSPRYSHQSADIRGAV